MNTTETTNTENKVKTILIKDAVLDRIAPGYYSNDIDAFAYTDGQFAYYTENGHKKQSRLGRFIRKALNSAVTDKTVEDLVYKIKTYLETNITLEVREDIGDIYSSVDTSTWASDSWSCMSGKPAYWFNLYRGLDCKILVAKDKDGYIIGRSLIWEVEAYHDDLDGGAKVIKMLDRIYKKEEAVRHLMINYARENGMAWVVDGEVFMEQDGEVLECVSVESTASFDLSDYEAYPYIDTLRYYDEDCQTLSNSGQGIVFDQTDGTVDGGDFEICIYSGNRYHRDEMVYVEAGNHEGYAHEDYVVYIDFGIDAGRYALEEDAYFSDANGGWCLA